MRDIVVALFIIILMFVFSQSVEPFAPLEDAQVPKYGAFGRPIKAQEHYIVTYEGQVQSESFKPPSAHGIYGCTPVPCPNVLQDDAMCWNCCTYD